MKLNNEDGGVVPVLIAAVLVIAASATVWLWQQQKVKELQNQVSDLSKRVTEAQKESETSSRQSTAALSDNIVTGQVVIGTNPAGVSTYRVECLIMPGELDEFWVEYGETSSNLSEETDSMSQGLGEGTTGEYGNFTQTVSGADVKAGTSYFYRCAGEQDGKAVAGGVASFTTKK